MVFIDFPTPEQYEKSPCSTCERATSDGQTFKGKMTVSCPFVDMCDGLKDFKGLEGGDFEVR